MDCVGREEAGAGPHQLVVRPGDVKGCHSEEPFNFAQDKLRDEESHSGRNMARRQG